MKLPDVVSVSPIASYRLRLRFDDGVEGDVDIGALVSFTGIFEQLKDPAFFARVSVPDEIGTIVWPNGADIDPLVLYAHVKGVSVEDLLAAEDALTG